MKSVACILALVAGLAAPARAHAQVDPSGPWHTLHTRHFRVHFRPAHRDIAHQAAREAERAYELLATELYPPREAVDITLSDDVDAANGFATTYPSNRLILLLSPPATDPALQRYDSWLRLVTVHELVHVFHLDRSRGVWDALQQLFGRVPGLFPNTYQPSWVVEGIATYYESKFTSGGRGNGSFLTEVLAADRTGEASRSPWDALFFTRWPAGAAPYAYGSAFWRHEVRAAGDSVVPRFVEATAGQVIPYRVGRPLRRVGGNLVGEWPRATHPPPAMAPDAPESRVVDGGLRTQPVPRASPNGRWVAYVRDEGTGARRLRVVDARSWQPVRTHRVNGSVSYDWLGDTLIVAQLDFTSRWRLRSDLYRWLPDGGWQRLTHGARLAEPRGGGGRLASIAITPGDNHPSVAGVPDPDGATWGAVVPSPDGRWTSATRHMRGNWALVRWPTAAPDSVAVLVESGGVITDPAWTPSPDGALLFVTEREGFPQVHRWTDSTGAQAVTGEPLGARTPAALADGSLLYTTLGARGWELRQAAPLSPPSPTAATADPSPVPFDSAPAVPARETGYAAGPSLRPHFWIPLFRQAGPAGFFLGGATAGTDAVGRHAYVVHGLFSADPVRAMGGLAAVSHSLGNPTLDVAVSTDWFHTGTTTGGTVVSERAQEAALGASFVTRRWRTTASLRVAAEFEGTRFVADPDTALGAICTGCTSRDVVGGSVSLSLAHFVRAPLSVSPQDGFAWMVLYRRREQQGAARWSNEVRTRLALYARLPTPVPSGFGRPVLSVRLAAGATDGPLRENLAVGGVSTGTFELAFGQSVGKVRTFPVRGYDVEEVSGSRAATAGVECRVPIALVGRAIGHLPVGTDKISLSLFSDVGNAWEPGAAPRLTRLRSVGAELVGDMTINYDLPLRIRLGAARPLADPPSGASRVIRVYVAFASDF